MARGPVVEATVPRLPPRAVEAHKGDVGRIVVIGGCFGEVTMIGAPALAANAALRGGAGLVQLFVPAEIRTAVAALAPCATLRVLPTEPKALLDAVQAFQADVLVVGPGLGDSVDGRALVELLQRFGGPVVIDADGLNLLARTPPFNIPNPGRVILTPHPGEMHRLLAGRGRDRPFDSTPEARREAAKTLHEAFGCIIVLKGHGTVVTDGGRLYVNSTGNAGMATAGTGDVLTGLIAALLGQKMAPFDAAVLGVHLHGLAGDLAAAELGQHPLIATDLIDFLPKAFRAHSG